MTKTAWDVFEGLVSEATPGKKRSWADIDFGDDDDDAPADEPATSSAAPDEPETKPEQPPEDPFPHGRQSARTDPFAAPPTGKIVGAELDPKTGRPLGKAPQATAPHQKSQRSTLPTTTDLPVWAAGKTAGTKPKPEDKPGAVESYPSFDGTFKGQVFDPGGEWSREIRLYIQQGFGNPFRRAAVDRFKSTGQPWVWDPFAPRPKEQRPPQGPMRALSPDEREQIKAVARTDPSKNWASFDPDDPKSIERFLDPGHKLAKVLANRVLQRRLQVGPEAHEPIYDVDPKKLIGSITKTKQGETRGAWLRWPEYLRRQLSQDPSRSEEDVESAVLRASARQIAPGKSGMERPEPPEGRKTWVPGSRGKPPWWSSVGKPSWYREIWLPWFTRNSGLDKSVRAPEPPMPPEPEQSDEDTKVRYLKFYTTQWLPWYFKQQNQWQTTGEAPKFDGPVKKPGRPKGSGVRPEAPYPGMPKEPQKNPVGRPPGKATHTGQHAGHLPLDVDPETGEPVKRGRGRPKGSKDLNPRTRAKGLTYKKKDPDEPFSTELETLPDDADDDTSDLDDDENESAWRGLATLVEG